MRNEIAIYIDFRNYCSKSTYIRMIRYKSFRSVRSNFVYRLYSILNINNSSLCKCYLLSIESLLAVAIYTSYLNYIFVNKLLAKFEDIAAETYQRFFIKMVPVVILIVITFCFINWYQLVALVCNVWFGELY